MGETDQHQTGRHQNSTPDEIRRKVAAYRAYKASARRRRHGCYQAALLLAVVALAAPLLIRHRHGLTHGCRSCCSWLTHAHRRHHHRNAGRA